MKRRTRYLLIVVGFVAFLILAPLIVFYTSGTLFDFGAKEYVATGILSLQTEPSDAKIFLNDKLETSTPASIRFLDSKEYTVRIEKEGYFSWTKRLEVKSGKVTWSTEDIPKLQLIKKDQAGRVVGSEVLDAQFRDNDILALTKSALTFYELDSLKLLNTIPLPLAVTTLKKTTQKSLLLGLSANTTLLINVDDKKVTNLSKEIKADQIISFPDTQTIIIKEGSTVSLFDIATKKKTVLESNVLSAAVRDADLYTLRADETSSSLAITTLQNKALTNERIIKSGLPLFTDAQLLATTQRELFIFSGGTVYRINDELETIAFGISSWEYQNEQSLLLKSPSELIYYDFSKSKSVLVTRASTAVIEPLLRQEIGYVFFAQDKKLVALELDTRDHQNRYELISADNVTALDANNNAKALLILDNGTLKTVAIR